MPVEIDHRGFEEQALRVGQLQAADAGFVVDRSFDGADFDAQAGTRLQPFDPVGDESVPQARIGQPGERQENKDKAEQPGKDPLGPPHQKACPKDT